MIAIWEGFKSTSDFVHWPMSHTSLSHTLDIQFPNELSREVAMVRQSIAVLLYKNRTLVSRTGFDDDDGVPEPLTGQYQTPGLGGGGAGCHHVSNLVIIDENVNADNYVRTLSEKPLENIFGDRNHPFVFQYDNNLAHTAHRTVAWLEQQDIFTMQWPSQSPDLNMIQKVCDFISREIIRVMPVTGNDLIRALHNTWLIITMPPLHNLYNSLPGRVRAGIR